ncbi:MAG: dienelactone hydrolase family protein [Ginsengibacter sp.]
MTIHAIKKNINQIAMYIFFLTGCFIILSGTSNKAVLSDKPLGSQFSQPDADTIKRKLFLDQILKLLPVDNISSGHVSFLDTTFNDWLKRTGELPPDFDKMPSIPFLPDPLVIDEGGKNIPVKTKQQWSEKREWMKRELQYYITGTYPPAPNNLQAKILSEKKDDESLIRMVELSFGSNHNAKLLLELMIPPGKGPFPVFMTQWEHRGWAQIAVRRGYVGCVYAGGDDRDDTEKYAEIWSPEYDFTRLMRRAFGASRAIDYLYTLPFIDKGKIGLSGHSRNGKQSLWAAAFDNRITAVVSSSGGSGAEVPWRYASHKYDVEDIALLACAQPAWLHPRLRFFIGRENKLPVDQNLFMALIAPRGLLLSYAKNEIASNAWGIEKAYEASQKVYRFLGNENNVAIRSRPGQHGITATDISAYVDFFDYVFKRSSHKPENKLYYDYSFENWVKQSGEKINPLDYPVKSLDDIQMDAKGKTINNIKDWEVKKATIQKRMQFIIGKEPAGISTPGPISFANNTYQSGGEEFFGSSILRPDTNSVMAKMEISPYAGFGDYLYGTLYYPRNKEALIKNGSAKLPVMVYLHEYDYSKGFSSQYYDHRIQPFFEEMVSKGFAVFTYDMFGFGNRIDEQVLFYQRFPHWSKMGKMINDLEGAIETLVNLNFVDSTKISVAGYSIGATVALYTAALDSRISSVVAVCGFTPMRLDTPQKGTEGIKGYSHLRGILPRLGFLVGNETRIPYDFHEVMASIAPRRLLVIAPEMDKDASLKDINKSIQQSQKIYQLYGRPENLQIFSPVDYNRFSKEMQDETAEWIQNKKMEK